MFLRTNADWRSRVRVLKERFVALAFLGSVTTVPLLVIVRRFREARALSPTTALPFHAQSAIEEFEFARLLRSGIVRESTPGRYYLDERTLAALATRRD